METQLPVLMSLTAFLSQHTQLALTVLFAAALLESVAVIGIFIPGSTLVFAGGALIGLGVLSPGAAAAAAVGGAVLGDGLSFWLGRHYGDRIRTMPLFSRHAALLQRGEDSFARHGAASIFLGRFNGRSFFGSVGSFKGPMRAIVPVVAGMARLPGMSAWRFHSVDGVAALAWAAACLSVGALFGASLQLAGAISARLALLLLVVLVCAWLLWRAVRLAHGWLVPMGASVVTRARDGLVRWARSGSQPQHRVVLALFDPQRAESPALLVAAVVLVGGAWLFLEVFENVLAGDALVQFDQAVFSTLQRLRTPWVDTLMVAITEIGGAAVAMPVIGAAALLFAVQRRWRTLAYWAAAFGFAQLLVWVLKLTVARTRPSPVYTGIEQYSFPSGHATSAIVLYGFLAFLLARGCSARWKLLISAVAAGFVLLIAFSRLYLGAHWFSDVVAGLSVGLAWVALLAIAYTHRVREASGRTAALALTSLSVLVLASAIQIGTQLDQGTLRYSPQPLPALSRLESWPDEGWRGLPAHRTDFEGEAEEPLSLQFAATQAELVDALHEAGWQTPPRWTLKTALLWLLPRPAIEQLPVLPKLNQDAAPGVVLSKPTDARTRRVLRLWPSGRAVLPPWAVEPRPLWLGTVTVERLVHPAGAFTLARTDPGSDVALAELGQELAARSLTVAQRQRAGRPVLLVW